MGQSEQRRFFAVRGYGGTVMVSGIAGAVKAPGGRNHGSTAVAGGGKVQQAAEQQQQAAEMAYPVVLSAWHTEKLPRKQC